MDKKLDFTGMKISCGDILTGDYYDPFFSKEYYERNYPSMSEEDIINQKNKPLYVVKINEEGRYFGEGLEESGADRMYLHDFRFNYTKITKNITQK